MRIKDVPHLSEYVHIDTGYTKLDMATSPSMKLYCDIKSYLWLFSECYDSNFGPSISHIRLFASVNMILAFSFYIVLYGDFGAYHMKYIGPNTPWIIIGNPSSTRIISAYTAQATKEQIGICHTKKHSETING